MTAQTYSAMPPIELNAQTPAHPLRGVFITVIALKIAIAAFLLATVSLAPPVAAEDSYMTVASN